MREITLRVLAQSPREYGLEQTRWTLEGLLGVLPIEVSSPAGLWSALRRLGIRFRQGWDHLISPDPLAEVKLAYLEAILARGQLLRKRVRVLWLDELTFYRLPTLAAMWSDGQAARGPKARLRSGPNTKGRIAAAFDHFTGQLHYLLRSRAGVRELILLYHQIRAAYPPAQEIYVIQDCWPVHFLPDVTRAAVQLGITLVPLPTYSSWRNPIEKLWRWLKQDVLHMHPWADDWPRVKAEVAHFLDRFHDPNMLLLRYVGLSD